MQNNILGPAILAEVRAEMARRQVTRRSIAEATDSDPATVGNWLSGKTPIRLRDLLTICDVLGVMPEALYERARAAVGDAT